jgi:hypothetical protein
MSGQRGGLHLHLCLEALRVAPPKHLPDHLPISDLAERHGYAFATTCAGALVVIWLVFIATRAAIFCRLWP